MDVLKEKLKIELPYDLAIPLLSIYLKKNQKTKTQNTNLKRYMHPHLIATLLRKDKMWKQPRCPLMDEYIKNWYIYTMKCSVQFSPVAQSCPTLCDPMNCSMPGLPVHHQHMYVR